MDDKELRLHLLGLERELQTAPARHSEGRLRTLLAPDFREIGRSGGRYGLAETLASLTAERTIPATSIEDFVIHSLSETVVLATYRGIRFDEDGTTVLSNRSSIWRRSDDQRWQLVFHQGTPAA